MRPSSRRCGGVSVRSRSCVRLTGLSAYLPKSKKIQAGRLVGHFQHGEGRGVGTPTSLFLFLFLWRGIVDLRGLFVAVFGFRHSGDATHASSGRAQWQGAREAEPDSRLLFNSTTLDPLVRSDPRNSSCLNSRIRLKVVTKKRPRSAAAVAEQTARGRKKKHRPPPQRAAVAGVCPSGHGGCFKLH